MIKRVIFSLCIFLLVSCNAISLLTNSPQLLDKAGKVLDAFSNELVVVEIEGIRIHSDQNTNLGKPVRVDMVFFDDESIKNDLIGLTGKMWFQKSNDILQKNLDTIVALNFEVPRSYDTGYLSLKLSERWRYLIVFSDLDNESSVGRYPITKSGEILDLHLMQDDVKISIVKKP